VIQPGFVPPEWLMVAVIALLFAWGFSKRTEVDEPVLPESLSSEVDMRFSEPQPKPQEISVE